MSTKRNKSQERGVALLAVIALLIIFLIFAGAVVTQLAQEVNSAHNAGVSNRALSAADAGVHQMIVSIEEAAGAGGPDPGPMTYKYPEPGAAPSVVKYTVSIQQKWNPLQPAGSRYYLVTSTGTVDNGIEQQNRTVSALIQAQSVTTFGSASVHDTNQFGKPVWYTPDQSFNGPVYDGGPMNVEYDDASSSPIFGVDVSTPNNPNWVDLQGGTTPTTLADWASIVSGGQPNFVQLKNPVGLPDPLTNAVVASEAYFGDCCSLKNYPNISPGVYMNQHDAAGSGGSLFTGIYVNGNATIKGQSAGSVETLTIKSPTGAFVPYQISIDFGANTTTVLQGGVTKTYTGVPSGNNGPGLGNGAIFINGNATLQQGTVIQGQYTLAVPDDGVVQRNITISGVGSITYSDPSKDELGLWANNVIVNTNDSNVAIDASIIAGFPGESATSGGFYNANCNANTCGNVNQGNLTINGSLMENMHGALGKFISITPPVHTGFARVINYDARLASNPPPFYPVTGNYTIVAWEDVGL